MARGFESKSVADQQESAFEERTPAAPATSDATRRKLELARTDVLRRLGGCTDPRMKEMLNRALKDLDKSLAK